MGLGLALPLVGLPFLADTLLALVGVRMPLKILLVCDSLHVVELPGCLGIFGVQMLSAAGCLLSDNVISGVVLESDMLLVLGAIDAL